MSMAKEFKDFISKGNVMDMAVGFIIGAAFTAIVSSLVADLINPIIGLVIGGIDFSNAYFTSAAMYLKALHLKLLVKQVPLFSLTVLSLWQ